MTIPRLYWLLLLFHTELLIYSQTTLGSHKENHPLALGGTTIQGIRRTKNPNVFQPSPSPTELRQMIHLTSQGISVWRGCHTLTGG